MTPQVSSKTIATAPASNTLTPLIVVMSLYFVWGSITSLNDIIIPHLKSIFSLSYAEAMLVQFFFFSAYFVFAYPSSWVVQRIGYKRTIVLGLAVVGGGALLFIPAASLASFAAFLFALSILAAGMTFMQVSANPYVSALGDPRFAAARLNAAGVFNSLGTTVAPLIGSVLILPSVPEKAMTLTARIQQASSVKGPYLGIGIALFIFAAIMASFKLPSIAEHEGEVDPAAGSVWRHRHLLLGVIAIFMYVGAEVAVGSLMISFMALPSTAHLGAQAAARYVSIYWGGLLIGRIAGATILRNAPANKGLAIAGTSALICVLIAAFGSGPVAIFAVLLTGLFHSVMWPDIFTLAIEGLGPLTSRGSGLLISGIIGGAILPLCQGWFADHIGLQHSYVLVALAYVYIAFYGFQGYKRRALNDVPPPIPAA